MARLGRDIRANVKAGASIPAYITDVHFGKASVRMLRNGQRLHNLQVIGGPVVIGQAVRVDFTTAIPTIIVTGQQGITQNEVQNIVDEQPADPYVMSPQQAAQSAGHVIQDEGVDLAEQPNLNFEGALVVVTNDETYNATKVTIRLVVDHNGNQVTNDASILDFRDD